MPDISELWNKAEELHPDLLAYMEQLSFGPAIRHPLVFAVPYFDRMNAVYNEQYRERSKAVDTAKREKNWNRVLAFHERPYRLEAFLEFCDDLTDKEYWEIVAWLWTDCENIWQNRITWEEIFERKNRHLIFSPENQSAFDALPDIVCIWRGHSGSQFGMSWTTDKAVAEKFARRFGQPSKKLGAKVTEGECYKKDILAFFTDRDESEVVVLPENVEIKGTYNAMRKMS